MRREAGLVTNIGLFGKQPNPRSRIDKTVIGATVTTCLSATSVSLLRVRRRRGFMPFWAQAEYRGIEFDDTLRVEARARLIVLGILSTETG